MADVLQPLWQIMFATPADLAYTAVLAFVCAVTMAVVAWIIGHWSKTSATYKMLVGFGVRLLILAVGLAVAAWIHGILIPNFIALR